MSVDLSPAAITGFRHGEQDNIRVPKLKRLLDALIECQTVTTNDVIEALVALVPAANKAIYFTGADTAALYDLTAFARTILDDADAATVRTTIGAQPLDAELSALAGLVSAADSLPYFTGSGTAALTGLSSVARTLIGQATQALMRTAGLGLGDIATANATAMPALTITTGNLTMSAGRISATTTGGFAGVFVSNVTVIALDTGNVPKLALRTAAGVAQAYIGTSATDIFTIHDNAGTSRVTFTLTAAAPAMNIAGTKVVGTRKTGWAVPTGTAARTTFDTATVTTAELAQRVKALIEDLHGTAGHGLIGT